LVNVFGEGLVEGFVRRTAIMISFLRAGCLLSYETNL